MDSNNLYPPSEKQPPTMEHLFVRKAYEEKLAVTIKSVPEVGSELVVEANGVEYKLLVAPLLRQKLQKYLERNHLDNADALVGVQLYVKRQGKYNLPQWSIVGFLD